MTVTLASTMDLSPGAISWRKKIWIYGDTYSVVYIFTPEKIILLLGNLFRFSILTF